MTRFFFSLLFVFAFLPLTAHSAESLIDGAIEVSRGPAGEFHSCINVGGACDGSVPCCGQNTSCVDRVCRENPEDSITAGLGSPERLVCSRGKK